MVGGDIRLKWVEILRINKCRPSELQTKATVRRRVISYNLYFEVNKKTTLIL
jgi:hypothetical protein